MHAASRTELKIWTLRTFNRFTFYAVGPIAAAGRTARAGYRGDWDRALPIWRMHMAGMVLASDRGCLTVGQRVAYKLGAYDTAFRPWTRACHCGP